MCHLLLLGALNTLFIIFITTLLGRLNPHLWIGKQSQRDTVIIHFIMYTVKNDLYRKKCDVLKDHKKSWSLFKIT